MWVLPLLGYVGVVLGFAFLTLAIGTLFRFASGARGLVWTLGCWVKKMGANGGCSFGTLLPERIGRGTYGAGEKAAHAIDHRRRRVTGPPSRRRWIPAGAQRAEYRLACHICAESTAVPHR